MEAQRISRDWVLTVVMTSLVLSTRLLSCWPISNSLIGRLDMIAAPPDVGNLDSYLVSFSGLQCGWIGEEKQESSWNFPRFFLWDFIWIWSAFVSDTKAIIHDRNFWINVLCQSWKPHLPWQPELYYLSLVWVSEYCFSTQGWACNVVVQCSRVLGFSSSQIPFVSAWPVVLPWVWNRKTIVNNLMDSAILSGFWYWEVVCFRIRTGWASGWSRVFGFSNSQISFPSVLPEVLGNVITVKNLNEQTRNLVEIVPSMPKDHNRCSETGSGVFTWNVLLASIWICLRRVPIM